jgi:hypothetical protein
MTNMEGTVGKEEAERSGIELLQAGTLVLVFQVRNSESHLGKEF